WEGKTLAEICAQIKDPARNGGRPLEALVHHIGSGILVGWAWAPGYGRPPAPGTQKAAGALVEAWGENGGAGPNPLGWVWLLDSDMNSRRSLDHLVGTCRSQNGALWNVALRPPGQSAFMPANFTTLPHFSVSSAMSLPKSAREPASNMPPMSASCVLILGSARPALISLLSLSFQNFANRSGTSRISRC